MKNSEAPGAPNRSNPNRATTIPSTKTSHQGTVSPLLPAYPLTLHLPRRLSTPSSPHYGHGAPAPASILRERILLSLFTACPKERWSLRSWTYGTKPQPAREYLPSCPARTSRSPQHAIGGNNLANA